MEEMSKSARLTDFELIVMLGVIRLGEDCYGVPIARELELHTGREVALASVYAALERLEEKGYVTSALGGPTPERGGRAKRFFRPTNRGLRAVRETRRILTGLWAGLPELQPKGLA